MTVASIALSLCAVFGDGERVPEPGAVGGAGLALLAAKILCVPYQGPQVIDHGVVLVKDGKILAVGPRAEVTIPATFELLDLGERWLTPGFIDLHNHAATPGRYDDLNDMVYLVNPDLRASPSFEPFVEDMQKALAGGVTTVLLIPGSGTNIGGQGLLVKTAFEHYEENLVRDPGSMKLAQWGNPEGWGPGVAMAFENWNTRNTIRRGVAYAERWKGKEPGSETDLTFEVFRDLVAREIAISVHTQVYQVVLMTITMIGGEFDLPVFTDHSEIGGWLAAPEAVKEGVPAIIGPRTHDHVYNRGFINWARNKHEGVRGLAAGWQSIGQKDIGFNTDSPFVPEEELLVQATMGVRYGMDDAELAALRGLTIVPARAAAIDERVGSIEPGKDADLLVCDGYPVDPRVTVERTFVNGRLVYDLHRDERRW
ncbi:MAG: amidohydrolase family protein [Planctomycetota bacterium]